MNQPQTVVHLVDDDTSFLLATGRLLRASGYTVRAFTSGTEFLEECGNGSHGCVVADLQMPGMTGFDLQETLLRLDHSMPVIFLSGEGDIPASVRAMRKGAVDFLEKTVPKEKLLSAITSALCRAEREREERMRMQQLRARFHVVSTREREVLGQVIQGKLNKQIASELCIGERTVKAHRTSLTTKLGVHSVAELTRLAHEAGIFNESEATCPKGQ